MRRILCNHAKLFYVEEHGDIAYERTTTSSGNVSVSYVAFFKITLLTIITFLGLLIWGSVAQSQIVVLEDFEGSSLKSSGYNSFSTAFPAGSSPIINSTGSSGYFYGNPPIIDGRAFLPPSQGMAYSGLHSEGQYSQEVILANLAAGPGVLLFTNNKYSIQLDAYQMNLSHLNVGPQNLFNSPGYVDIFGIRVGASPTLNSVTQANSNTISALPGVDLLGSTSLVSNKTAWQTYTINFTAQYDYDRLLILPRAQQIGASTPNDDPFLAIDYIRYEQHPNLTLDKSGLLNDLNGNDLIDLGETITYSFLVTNTGAAL